MKRLTLSLALLVLLVAAVFAIPAESQDAPDIGERDPLVAACNHLRDVGEMGGLLVRNCRRSGPDDIQGNNAFVHVRIATNQGTFNIDVTLVKSPWHVSAFIQR